MTSGRILLLFFSLLGGNVALYAQNDAPKANVKTTTTVMGVVRNEGGEPLPGVYIHLVGTIHGTLSNDDGRFELQAASDGKLIFSITGYEPQEVVISSIGENFVLTLTPSAVLQDEVVVSASRQNEKLAHSPVTIEKMDLQDIRESTAPNLYDALAYLKGVDISASSITMKSINTRGFNSPANSRFLQRIDGVDMQTPGLNIPLGALNGSADLDVESVELVPGSSSALYGPNAFNGMLNVSTKSPFQFPGLSAMVRGSFNHLDNIDAKPSLLSEMALRYAKSFKDKIGFKVNVAYLSGEDWHATDYRDMADYSGTINVNRFGYGRNNPGYDGLNTYGDEVSNVFDSTTFAGSPIIPIKEPTRIARTGYTESDLYGYHTYSLRADGGVYFRLAHSMELSLTSRIARGSSVIQADNRVALQDFTVHTHKIELRGHHFFLRAYASLEDAGKSFDTRFAGINLNRAWKSDDNWFAQYIMAYSGVFNLFNVIGNLGKNPITPGVDAEARAFADGDNSAMADNAVLQALLGAEVNRLKGGARLTPGTPEFNQALDKVKNTTGFNSGARFVDNTKLFHTEGQYDFTGKIKFVDILTGGNVRVFALNSQGLVFGDTAGTIWAPEGGAYVQATKRFWDDKLKFVASGRVDKARGFAPQFSPRIAAVFSTGLHNFRASFQTGFKNPDLRNRYLNFNVSIYQVIGGFEDAFRQNGLLLNGPEGTTTSNAYTLSSVQDFLRTRDTSVLVRQNMDVIRPEYVQNMEIGYRGAPLGEKFPLMVDVCYYRNRYKDFIGMVSFVGPEKKAVGTADVALTPAELLQTNPDGSPKYQRFRRYANATEVVTTQGATIGLIMPLSNKFTIGGNYSFNQMITQTASRDFNTEFNTPTHKAGVSFTARDIWKKMGFSVNYRWSDAYNYQYSFASGPVPAYGLVDANLSFRVPRYNSTLKVGGVNVLNNRHIEVFGGPTVGGMLYLQVTYDSFLN